MVLSAPCAAQTASLALTANYTYIEVNAGDPFSLLVTLVSSSDISNVVIGGQSQSSGININSKTFSTVKAGQPVNVQLDGYVLSSTSPDFYKIHFFVSYEKEGQTIQSFLGDEVSVKVTRYLHRPFMAVSKVTFTPTAPNLDEPFLVHIEFGNVGSVEARNVTVTFDGLENFEVTDLTNRVNFPSMWGGNKRIASFRVQAKKGRVSNRVQIKFAYLHETEETQMETLNLPLGEVVNTQPALRVAKFATVSKEGGQFALKLDISNTGGGEARDIRIFVDGGQQVYPADAGSNSRFERMVAGGTVSVEFLLRVTKAQPGYPVTVTLNYTDRWGERFQVTEPLYLTPQVRPAEPMLKIGEFSAVKGTGKSFTLRFQLQNLGAGGAKDIAVRFESGNVFPDGTSNVLYLPALAAGTATDVTVKMNVSSIDSASFAMPVSIQYRSDTGVDYTNSEVMTISASSLGLKSGGGTPRVMLSKYTLSASQILAGNTVRLTLYIDNSSTQEVGNIKISLGVIQMEGNTGGTVFSPVNGSNSFFINSISPKKTVIKEIDLYVDPNAAAKTYIVPVEIAYEDAGGISYKADELVNIPVTQESRLQVLTVDIPPTGFVGQPLPVSAEFVNVGKVALKNFLISVEGDFPKENATYFLASFEIGQSDYFQGMIIPQAEGPISGTVVFSYTDNTNQEVRIEKPFEVNVQQMEGKGPGPGEPYPPEFPPDNGIKQPILSRIKGALFWLLPALIILFGGVFILVKKVRARRGEMFDEEL